MGIARAVEQLFNLIFLIIFITVLLSWFPNIKWYSEPFRSMKLFSDIFLTPFRKFIPPLGMIDVSPIVALFALSLLKNIIVGLLDSIGV